MKKGSIEIIKANLPKKIKSNYVPVSKEPHPVSGLSFYSELSPYFVINTEKQLYFEYNQSLVKTLQNRKLMGFEKETGEFMGGVS